MRYTGPKARLCRREGVNLFGSPKYQKILQRNPNIPGMHGSKRAGKLTEYGKQLREKQKAKRMFGLSERQFHNYYVRADKSNEVTGDKLFELLERRLDNVLYRAGFALTRMQGRQFASHGLFLVNGRKIDIPSYEVRIGDKIEIKDSKKNSPVFVKNKEETGDYNAPSWVKVDPKKQTIEIVELPSTQHFESLVEPQLIVEFYSR
ncbi:30S ribosomal protein S4 [Candidatus Gracilibacteria bacterium]|nr:30S ribosomal protein S4 [Candidatus Gracilibacteria bacterium]MCF7819378.1 30S ribosomal protein S4 [Candidatus Gracilibacteria bacterium]